MEELMMQRLLLVLAAATLAATMACAGQAQSTIVLPVGKTAPTNGRQMYTSYCAPCHGMDGRGHGTLAAALTVQPSDLTLLSRNHRGRFPDNHVVSILQFGIEKPAHSAMQMPAWGPILAKMNQSNRQDRLLRVCNLSRYLDAIQVR